MLNVQLIDCLVHLVGSLIVYLVEHILVDRSILSFAVVVNRLSSFLDVQGGGSWLELEGHGASVSVSSRLVSRTRAVTPQVELGWDPLVGTVTRWTHD